MSKNAERVQIESRAEWRAWLAEHHAQDEGIWLVTFKKHTGDRYVAYDDVVEEALCFGWVDSLPRKLDDERSMLYISPRRKGSPWSGLNKRRIAKLNKQGLMMPPGEVQVEQAKADGTWTVYDEIEDLVIPNDLDSALDKNPTAREHFNAFSDSSKKGILWWIKSAKRDATRKKRVSETVRLAEMNVKANYPEAKGK